MFKINLVVRYYGSTFVSMKKEKRKVRSYKMADGPYKKAIKKSKEIPLATKLEALATAIGEGKDVIVVDKPAKK